MEFSLMSCNIHMKLFNKQNNNFFTVVLDMKYGYHEHSTMFAVKINDGPTGYLAQYH